MSSGASDWPRKITVAEYMPSSLLTRSSQAIEPPMTQVAHCTTRR